MTNDSTDAIRLIQRGFDKPGHTPGTIDGRWGVRTARALRQTIAANGQAASLSPQGPLPWITEAKTALGRKEPLLGALGVNPYWARNWLLFGQDTKPVTGAVLIFERGSGGHVGFALGQDYTHFFVLGGNQSDAVTVARVVKSRLLGAHWPATYPPRLQRLQTMKKGEFLATTNEI